MEEKRDINFQTPYIEFPPKVTTFCHGQERERERERDKKRNKERVRDRKGGESELREIESETGSEERVREGGEREGRRIKSWVSVGFSAWRVKDRKGRESERRVRWERKRE